jgi:lipopolysaccharide transport system permease protein
LGFVLNVGLWLSPVIYAPSMIPASVRSIYHLNPMVGVLLGFRAALFAGFPVPAWELCYSAGCAVVLLAVGIWAFRRTEVQLADRL